LTDMAVTLPSVI